MLSSGSELIMMLCIAESKNIMPVNCRGSNPLEIGRALQESSSQEASDISNSAFISAFVFS